jgi:hypothetical protein
VTEGSKAGKTDETERQELFQLIKKARAGNAEAMARVREAFDQKPYRWEVMGNMAKVAERTLIGAATGDDPLTQEAMERQLVVVREELAGANPTPMERLLAERAALCWFYAYFADTLYAQNLKGSSLAMKEHLQKLQDRTHRRFLSSVRTLALVRRLALPVSRPAVTNENANRGEFLELGEVPHATG